MTPATATCGRPRATHDLVLWDFHDLLFHARSTPGRHANPLGGALSLCGRHAFAAGRAAPLAGKDDRSPQGRALALAGGLADRTAAA